jgi:hypothetical protein
MTGNPPRGVRALALMAALFAVTLNFLQPLAHAASMRDGNPSALWSMFCNSAVADPANEAGSKADATPTKSADKHECCLGLAHAPSLIAPSSVFVALPPLVTALASSLPSEQRPAVAIRDGPTRPRGPPSFA